MKYSDYLAEELLRAGYTKCFTLGGGNIMHLVESFSKSMEMIPVVHEVTAAIAAEHFNAVSPNEKAVVLVTTGPGITNCVTAVASAFVESRGLLVIGGQVKTSDLAFDAVRQVGIQEIDGQALLRPITKSAHRALTPLVGGELSKLLNEPWEGRKGPVFLEIPLDVQAKRVDVPQFSKIEKQIPLAPQGSIDTVLEMFEESQRPIILVGSGTSRAVFKNSFETLQRCGIPLMTTWNAADFIDNRLEIFFGRPNNWGQRFANALLQQADLVIALGARLGLQQTGFNWSEFASNAKVVQVDIDPAELEKKEGLVDLPIRGDASDFLVRILPGLEKLHLDFDTWVRFGNEVKLLLPVSEAANSKHEGFWNPYDFYLTLSRSLGSEDVLLPCSSGSSFTTAYQAVELNGLTRMFSSKSLASMGYGLGAAVGIAKASPFRPILVEGDGGFAQNLQDIGTLYRANPNSKIFVWINDGYASIRKTQQSYFGGNYVGCDTETGLMLPNLKEIFKAFGLRCEVLQTDLSIADALEDEVHCYLVPIHPEQTYFPKITSRVRADGHMESAPLHLMTPELSEETAKEVFRFL